MSSGTYQHEAEGIQSPYERAIEGAAMSGEVLGEGIFTVNYGRGVRIDIQAFLKESHSAKRLLEKLDPVERFVLLGYFLLRKTEKQLADLVGLNECRFNQFLENLVNKVGAILAFEDTDPEVWNGVLEREGMQTFRVRGILPEKPTRATRESKDVRTTDVLTVFLKKRSFLEVGKCFLAYYVDLRRGLEIVAEDMKAKRNLASYSLGEFIGSQIQFAGVKQEGYAGRMGRLPQLVQVRDAAVLGHSVIRMDNGETSEILIPRALGAIQGGF